MLPRQSSSIPPQCQSACGALTDQGVLNGAAQTETAATAAACTSTNLQNIKSCFECGYNLAPSAFPPSAVQAVQDAIDGFAAECNKRGFPVQCITLTGATGKCTNGKSAALSRYEGTSKVVGAVGVAAVAGFLAL